MILDPVGGFSDEVDRLSVDASLRDQFVGLQLVDGPPFHLLLQCEVVPVVARLQSLQQVVFVKDGLLLVGLGAWVHFQQNSCRLA